MTNEPTVVALTGEYDVARRDELDYLLDRYGDAEPLVFDLDTLEGIDTAAVRSLVRFQRARRAAGKSPLVLARPRPQVRHFIELANLQATFEVREDI